MIVLAVVGGASFLLLGVMVGCVAGAASRPTPTPCPPLPEPRILYSPPPFQAQEIARLRDLVVDSGRALEAEREHRVVLEDTVGTLRMRLAGQKLIAQALAEDLGLSPFQVAHRFNPQLTEPRPHVARRDDAGVVL